MKTYIVDFIITFSPIIVGLLAFFIYWLIRDYRKLRKFSYRHDHAIENIQGLSSQIEILKKEPANRVEDINQLSKKINDLAQDCYRVVKKQTEMAEQEESSTRNLKNLQEIIDDVAKK